MLSQFGVKIDLEELNGLFKQEIEDHINELLERRFKEKEDLIGPENMREAERVVMLNVIDNQWKDHLLSMDHLKEGIGLRGYGQKDPLIEYKKESFELFQDMMDRIEDETIRYLFFLQVTTGPPPGESGNGGGPGGLPERPKPVLPFSDDDDEDEEDEDDEEALVGGQFRAAPRRAEAPSKISRATSSAKKTRKWPRCNLSAAAAPRPKTSRPSRRRRPAATIRVRAVAARNIRNATEPES